MEYRILIHAPTGKDARLIREVLTRASMECQVCGDAAEIAGELKKGAAALFIVDEALNSGVVKSLAGFLKVQPTWSDLPIIVLSQRTPGQVHVRSHYQDIGNVTLLERPVQSVTLVSAASAATRARRRQYEMREIDRRKDEFLAMLAHELRNPLAPIAAASALLKMPDLDRERVHQTSEIISRQVVHMTGLIDDLLDVSRVSRGLVTIEGARIDAGLIVDQAVEQVRPLIDARRHRLTVKRSAAFVDGDLKRLIQVLANLLNNAAKYTPDGGEIVLSMDADDSNVIFSVSDNGIGIEPAVIAHVFDMFAQAERTSDRSQGGLGIGLALVKSLVHLHGGSVLAHSDGAQCGSRFTVTLPRVVEQATPQTAQQDVAPVDGKQRRLMIVDDNVDAAGLLGMLLEFSGYDIMVEHSAKAALEQVGRQAPDAFLLDIGLPDMDGGELAACLRARPESANALLIAITGYGQDSDRQRTAAAGFDHHFVKPVDMVQLLAVLATL